MLSSHIAVGVKLIGLAELITSGKPAFDGLYRVVDVGGVTAVEFFAKADRPADQRKGVKSIKILPYRLDAIADVPLSGHEAISGEFTGCLMTVFKKDGVTRAGHVDTNVDTSKRAEWNQIKAAGDPNSTLEYDTTGKLTSYPGGADGKVILCVARKGSIEHYFVSKSRLVYGKPTMNHLGAMQAKQGVVYTVLPAHGL
jgi:hypothetical protein